MKLPESQTTKEFKYTDHIVLLFLLIVIFSIHACAQTPVDSARRLSSVQLSMGIDKVIKLKGESEVGIYGLISQSTERLRDESTVSAIPNLTSDPFPFADIDKSIISAQSKDINHISSTQIGGTLNTYLRYGHNKIALKSYISSRSSEMNTQRSEVFKPDEDSFAHRAIYYLNTQQHIFNTQLSGEHVLNSDSKFKLSWRAAYSYFHQRNPDERNLLLRQDPSNGDLYELAHPTAAAFNPVRPDDPNMLDPNLTNSGRQWRGMTDNNFEGAVNISVPFNLFNQLQAVYGGIFVQNKYRRLHSNISLVKGPGYYPSDSLLAQERYDSGELTATNYYKDFNGSYNYVYANNRGNYSGSANLGGAYIRLENKLAKSLSVNWGIRLETSSQLVSNTQYNYDSSSKKPDIIPLDKNIFVNRIDLLPSVRIIYQPVKGIQFYTGYSRAVIRPQLEDLTAYRYYNPISFLVKIGNPILQSTRVDNYEAGINLTLDSVGSIISVSGFYKRIDQPIENILSLYTISTLLSQPHNTPPATVYGVQASFNLKINYFSFFGNGTWLRSKVDAGPVRNKDIFFPEHRLTGTPDYTINGGLSFEKAGIPALSILYNRTGDYFTALGAGPVKGRSLLDISISQKLFKSKFTITAAANNLLEEPYIEYITYIKSPRTYYIALSYLFK